MAHPSCPKLVVWVHWLRLEQTKTKLVFWTERLNMLADYCLMVHLVLRPDLKA
jgi:hypothetical protein